MFDRKMGKDLPKKISKFKVYETSTKQYME